jgi:hypothetical protein
MGILFLGARLINSIDGCNLGHFRPETGAFAHSGLLIIQFLPENKGCSEAQESCPLLIDGLVRFVPEKKEVGRS